MVQVQGGSVCTQHSETHSITFRNANAVRLVARPAKVWPSEPDGLVHLARALLCKLRVRIMPFGAATAMLSDSCRIDRQQR